MRIHLDPAIAMAADSPANMMPWNGDKRILIDRSAVEKLFLNDKIKFLTFFLRTKYLIKKCIKKKLFK